MEKEEGNVITDELKHANISLVLGSYDDIFSTFDARSYAEKALSVDFLEECKRAARDKDDHGLELILSIPRIKRNLNDEVKIKKRLREHFHHHMLDKDKQMLKIKREGKIWVTLGALLIFGIVFGMINIHNALFQAIFNILQVPGWFFVWEGMSKIFFDSNDLKPEREFYRKIANAQIIFRSY